MNWVGEVCERRNIWHFFFFSIYPKTLKHHACNYGSPSMATGCEDPFPPPLAHFASLLIMRSVPSKLLPFATSLCARLNPMPLMLFR